MAETSRHHETDARVEPNGAEPPAGGRQDHEAMRQSAMRPVSGPAGTDDLAAGGGLEVPGREPHTQLTDAPVPVQRREPIPGAREGDTLTQREPGAIGGQFSGGDTPPPRRSEWIDERTAIDRALEGGGDAERTAKRRVEDHQEP